MTRLLEIKGQLHPFLSYMVHTVPMITAILSILIAVIFFFICMRNSCTFGWACIDGVVSFMVGGIVYIIINLILSGGMTNLISNYQYNHGDDEGLGINTALIAKQANHNMAQGIHAKKQLPKLHKKLKYVKSHHQQKNELDNSAVHVYKNHLKYEIKHNDKIIKNTKRLQVKWYYYV